MTKHLTPAQIPELAETWTSLQRYAPLRPIQTADDFERVAALAQILAETVGDDASHPLYSLFELTMSLIEKWEDAHLRLPEAEPRDVLRCLLEANDLEPTDLGDVAAPELLGDILSGQRDIDEDLAKALSKRFHIDVKAFI
ncbi:hypothetical protein GCM10027321_12450 [Massilia terrae]|uniref:Transcriptional regulator n=1 Tax=Massilia terrae TaxID=1811224 RepID=A0ABT2D2K4_9BURK|nr:transcriptional regulator [Massilia terrae]MCS0660476.1 transcriptional regulator [Massilia terrae]